MAATQIHSCRLCCLPSTQLLFFSIDSVRAGTPGRPSSIVDLPVTADDGLSQYICRPCNRKFTAAESFRSTARMSYERKGFEKLSVHSSPKPPLVETTRKRTKDTNGIDASPHTSLARPLAKRFTTGVHGRDLLFLLRRIVR